MNSAIKNIVLATTVLVSAASTLTASAFEKPKSNFIVQQLSSKPEFTQNSSQDLLLRADERGTAYLYVEQQQGALLTVFDVTDPQHIKLTAEVPTEAHAAFDFVTPVGAASELVAFRDGSGDAVLDLHKAKAPRLSNVGGVAGAGKPNEWLGNSGYLTSSLTQGKAVVLQPREVQLVETKGTPRTITTVANVTRQVNRSETGTVFLLGNGKVTVIRRIDAERSYAIDQELQRNLN
jgi:hypothetical protein